MASTSYLINSPTGENRRGVGSEVHGANFTSQKIKMRFASQIQVPNATGTFF